VTDSIPSLLSFSFSLRNVASAFHLLYLEHHLLEYSLRRHWPVSPPLFFSLLFTRHKNGSNRSLVIFHSRVMAVAMMFLEIPLLTICCRGPLTEKFQKIFAKSLLRAGLYLGLVSSSPFFGFFPPSPLDGSWSDSRPHSGLNSLLLLLLCLVALPSLCG